MWYYGVSRSIDISHVDVVEVVVVVAKGIFGNVEESVAFKSSFSW